MEPIGHMEFQLGHVLSDMDRRYPAPPQMLQTCGFNWATSSQTWIVDLASTEHGISSPFQLGHVLSDMDRATIVIAKIDLAARFQLGHVSSDMDRLSSTTPSL